MLLKSHLKHLPEDILLNILLHLDTRSKLQSKQIDTNLMKKVRVCCRELNSLFYTPCLWETVILKPILSEIYQSHVKCILQRSGGAIKRIIGTDVNEECMEDIMKRCKQLEDLRFINTSCMLSHTVLTGLQSHLNAENVRYVFVSPNKLRRLDLHFDYEQSPSSIDPHWNARLYETIAKKCPKLIELHILSHQPLRAIDLRDMAKGCSQISKITLSACFDISNSDLLDFVSQLPRLKYLCLIRADHLSDSFLIDLPESAPQLQILILHCAREISRFGIAALANGSRWLEWIKVIKCRGLSLGAFDHTDFENRLTCPMIYPSFATGMGMAYKRITPASVNK